MTQQQQQPQPPITTDELHKMISKCWREDAMSAGVSLVLHAIVRYLAQQKEQQS